MEPTPRWWSSPLVHAGVILGAAFLANMPCCGNGLIGLDDFAYLTAVPDFRFGSIAALFAKPAEGYQPLALLSLGIDYRLWGPDPFGYHVVSLLLHLLNTLLVYAFVRILTRSGLVALVTALLFGVHPIHVEAIAWAASRKDLLYACFYLLAAIAYVRYLDRRSLGLYVLSLAAILLSFLSKGMAASIVFTLVAIDWYRGRDWRPKSAWLDKLPFLAMAIVWGVVNVHAQRASGYVPAAGQMAPLGTRLLLAGYGFCRYLGHLLWPVRLSAYYPYPDSTPLLWAKLWASAGAAMSLALLAVLGRWRWRGMAFALVFLGGNLVLVLQVVPVANFLVADRYAYLASVGFCLLAGLLCREALARRGALRAAAYGLPVLLALTYGMLSSNRCAVWTDGVTVWTDVLAQYPRAVFAWDQRGMEYYALRRYGDAVRDLDRALAIDPNYLRSYINRGAARYRAGDFRGAAADYDEVIRRDGGPDGYAGRGLAKSAGGDLAGGLADLDRAVALAQGKSALPYVNRSTVRNRAGDPAGALADADRALAIRPGHPVAWLNRATALETLGDAANARRAFAECLALDPLCEEARAGIERLGPVRRSRGERGGASNSGAIFTSP